MLHNSNHSHVKDPSGYCDSRKFYSLLAPPLQKSINWSNMYFVMKGFCQ